MAVTREQALDVASKKWSAKVNETGPKTRFFHRDLAVRAITRPGVEEHERQDPTECADGSSIFPALGRYLAEGEIIPLGGVVYNVAVNDVSANLDSEGADRDRFGAPTGFDAVLSALGPNPYYGGQARAGQISIRWCE